MRVARGPRDRPRLTPAIVATLRDAYGLRLSDDVRDLGGSSSLNLLVGDDTGRYVARVYRPWLSVARLRDIQRVRCHLADRAVPCSRPILTTDGSPWIRADGCLVELEPWIASTDRMNTWARLEADLPTLGRIHTHLRTVTVSDDGRIAPAANHIDAADVPSAVIRGTDRLRTIASEAERTLADDAERLAHLVAREERDVASPLPRQMVHGDYWDNNVCSDDGRIVLVADLDFMGERPRIDDLALTLYYTNSTFADGRESAARIAALRRLVDAYDRGLDEPLSEIERASLPVALARTALCFIAMIADVDADSEAEAHKLAAEMVPDIGWAVGIMRDLDRWRSGFA